MKKVLVLFAHPAVHKSQVNRALVRVAREIPGVEVVDLYAEYPDFEIDVAREQTRLLAHDGVVVQHPFYWYSAPAILKEWCDLVLEHGFAYGAGGTKLQGKFWVHALSAGGSAEVYRPEGANRFTVKSLLAPFDQTAYLCGMQFLDPFVVHGARALDAEHGLSEVAERYRNFLTNLVTSEGM